MATITIDFPAALQPKKVITILEMKIKQQAPHCNIQCRHVARQGNDNIYNVEASDPKAFYYLGAASTVILNMWEEINKKPAQA